MWTVGIGVAVVQKENFTKFFFLVGKNQLCCFIVAFDNDRNMKNNIDVLKGNISINMMCC